MIEARRLTKRYGKKIAVDELTFAVQPGRVTGFLGPNGSGKTTTMRLVLGLHAPTSGEVTVAGRPYRGLIHPLRMMGALLDAHDVLGGRSASEHLAFLAASNGIGCTRVDDVLEQVGLSDVAGRRVGGFSLGMLQRLGIAGALLGDPDILMLDEPVNGLDTEGIRWIRQLLRTMASEGKTVLLSSHLMSELELTVDHLLVIGAGRLIADELMADFVDRHTEPIVRVRSADIAALACALDRRVEVRGDTAMVRGVPAREIGRLAVSRGVVLDELTPIRGSLEDVYTRLIEKHGEYRHHDVRKAA